METLALVQHSLYTLIGYGCSFCKRGLVWSWGEGPQADLGRNPKIQKITLLTSDNWMLCFIAVRNSFVFSNGLAIKVNAL
jgi:hypothetical protein